MNSSTVIDLIAARHTHDVFVPECKDGPTWNSAPARLDAWAMRKSWTRPCTTGYEVKVARADWLRDKKWTGYVGLVNEFYLVSPADVIPLSEIPDGIGLLHVAKTGSRLFVRRKAKYRELNAEAAGVLMQYVLMSRVTIDAPRPPRTLEEWKEWLARKEESRAIGWRCSEALQQKYERDVEAVKKRCVEMELAAEFVGKVRKHAEALGVRWAGSGWESDWASKSTAEDIATALRARDIDPQDLRRLEELIPLLQRITRAVVALSTETVNGLAPAGCSR